MPLDIFPKKSDPLPAAFPALRGCEVRNHFNPNQINSNQETYPI